MLLAITASLIFASLPGVPWGLKCLPENSTVAAPVAETQD
jgi:hypothetical protein